MINTSLWKDRAIVELNTAVIHSFQVFLYICLNNVRHLSHILSRFYKFKLQKANVTVVDHHTAAESFMA